MSGEEWPGALVHSLAELEAFDAMRAFLEAYWNRGGKESDDIAVLLGSMNRDASGPLNLAQWYDWREAVESVMKHKPVEKPASGSGSD